MTQLTAKHYDFFLASKLWFIYFAFFSRFLILLLFQRNGGYVSRESTIPSFVELFENNIQMLNSCMAKSEICKAFSRNDFQNFALLHGFFTKQSVFVLDHSYRMTRHYIYFEMFVDFIYLGFILFILNCHIPGFNYNFVVATE